MINPLEKLDTRNELSQEDIMIKILETQKAEKERVSLLEKRVDNIEITAPIPAVTNKRLTRLRNAKVLECLGGKDA